ncbi:hypothetical protein Peur_063895 [Populus x canadensis]
MAANKKRVHEPTEVTLSTTQPMFFLLKEHATARREMEEAKRLRRGRRRRSQRIRRGFWPIEPPSHHLHHTTNQAHNPCSLSLKILTRRLGTNNTST